MVEALKCKLEERCSAVFRHWVLTDTQDELPFFAFEMLKEIQQETQGLTIEVHFDRLMQQQSLKLTELMEDVVEKLGVTFGLLPVFHTAQMFLCAMRL